MSFAELQNPIFTDENAAREALEACRWPNGPVCPHCGSVERNVLHGDRYIIEGLDKVEPNAKVCTEVQADRFLQLFVSRIQGK